ncbi:MAG: UDP-glucose--hexose-1-phosphate uridylyltransferase [Oscillospiraceae bacterium]|nr:UDP-glucose--hexose-1-phosphate uridylyltransferase [Oscillospiraceae bacterium]
MGNVCFPLIEALVDYAEKTGLADKRDRIYYTNRLLELLKMDSYEPVSPEEIPQDLSLQTLLDRLCDYAADAGIIGEGITERDLFDTRVMALFTPLPSAVQDRFAADYRKSPEAATDGFYRLSRDCNYIRTERVAKDLRWEYAGKYGVLDITINLSKPEKDPKAIAAALQSKASSYPRCQLCAENVGYAGRLDHPARQNLRVIPLTLAGEQWWFQYSPYVYYPEHCIVLNDEHTPMQITPRTFERLLDFVTLFPHYFIGSNADLPIVGGSILTHDHFQGGHYTFAMERATVAERYSLRSFPEVRVERLHWPLTVLRLTGEREQVSALANLVLETWRNYTDEAACVFAETETGRHNTVTPIARRQGELYQLDLVLRNNLTTPEHPAGLYHPHAEKHHIKKENIGLIEVMGLAVLPARLKAELAELADRFRAGLPMDTPGTASHAEWFEGVCASRPVTTETVEAVLAEEVGRVFEAVLEDAGVYRPDAKGAADFRRFVEALESRS